MIQDDADIDRFFGSGKRVAIELGTSLTFEVTGVDSRIKSSFIGMEPGRYVIIKMPIGSDEYQSKLCKGNSVIVRYLHEGTIYGFKTLILNTIAEPASLLFIEYPQAIEEHNLRASQRLDCYLPCKFRMVGSIKNDAGEEEIVEDEFEGVVADISKVGCRGSFASSKMKNNLLNIKEETTVMIYIQLPGISDYVKLIGVVKRMQLDQSSTNIGVKFSPMDGDVEEKIGNYLSIAS